MTRRVAGLLAGLGCIAALLSGCAALSGVHDDPPDYVKKYKDKDPNE